MENQRAAQNARSLTDLLRRRRDPAGDLPFDPDAEPPMEEGGIQREKQHFPQ